MTERQETLSVPQAPAIASAALQDPWLSLLLKQARNLKTGSLTIELPDGGRETVEGAAPGPAAVIRIHDMRVPRRTALGGVTGLAETYMEGLWTTPDLPALIALGARLEEDAGEFEPTRFRRVLDRVWHLLRPNTRGGSKRNIAAHYDLGNDFYRLWLDPSMTYSAALYERPATALEDAQVAKYRRMARIMDLRPGHHMLEIGCGWGGFACFCAREIGARVTAVTISNAQYEAARRRVKREGLEDRVDIRFQDYRDIEGTFDRIGSIEMFEAVGESHWPVFFQRLHDSLKPGGRAALQVITIDEKRFDGYRRSADFIQRYIFPGGMLPSPSILRGRAEGAGLTVRAWDTFGADYARTLAEWRDMFLRNWTAIEALPRPPGKGFDKRFKRLWDYYLAYCEGGFRAGSIDLVQLAVTRDP